jgi:hypothetical protein
LAVAPAHEAEDLDQWFRDGGADKEELGDLPEDARILLEFASALLRYKMPSLGDNGEPAPPATNVENYLVLTGRFPRPETSAELEFLEDWLHGHLRGWTFAATEKGY